MKRSSKYGNNYWTGYSHKMKRTIELFSDLEYDHWLLVECNPKIIRFCEQPLIIEETIHGEQFHSIPDMWVLYENTKEAIIEIKYLNSLLEEHPKYLQTMRQIEIQKKWAKRNNMSHFVFSEDKIRENRILLNNYRKIISYVRQFNPADMNALTMDIIQAIKGERRTLEQIFHLKNEPQNVIMVALMYLIYSGKVKSNIAIQTINRKMEVWIDGA